MKTTGGAWKKGTSHYEFIIYTVVKVHRYSGSKTAETPVTNTQADGLTTLPCLAGPDLRRWGRQPRASPTGQRPTPKPHAPDQATVGSSPSSAYHTILPTLTHACWPLAPTSGSPQSIWLAHHGKLGAGPVDRTASAWWAFPAAQRLRTCARTMAFWLLHLDQHTGGTARPHLWWWVLGAQVHAQTGDRTPVKQRPPSRRRHHTTHSLPVCPQYRTYKPALFHGVFKVNLFRPQRRERNNKKTGFLHSLKPIIFSKMIQNCLNQVEDWWLPWGGQAAQTSDGTRVSHGNSPCGPRWPRRVALGVCPFSLFCAPPPGVAG